MFSAMFFQLQWVAFIALLAARSIAFQLYAPIDSGGLRGNVTFSQEDNAENVQISIFLTSLLNGTRNFTLEIHEFPVSFDMKNPCQTSDLGNSKFTLSNHHRDIEIPPGSIEITFEANVAQLKLKGPQTIWGRSLLLISNDTRACSNVMSSGKSKIALARFTQNVAGSVLFRENELGETTILSTIFYNTVEQITGTRNNWRIMVTDVLDHNKHFKCNHLHILLDPDNTEDSACSANEQRNCKIGDLTQKHGKMVVGKDNNRYSKKFYVDLHLPLEHLESTRQLYVVIDDKEGKKPLACAQIVLVEPKEVKAIINMDGVKGEFTFKQNYRTDPTIITVKLDNLRGRGKYYHVHEFPFLQRQLKGDAPCSEESVGGHHNPFAVETRLNPLASTNDQYEVGDLSGKHGTLPEEQSISTFYFNSHVDFNLPLFGVHSIVGRSVVVHSDNGTRWICANIGYPERTIVAKATFYFPVIGQITFRQQHDDPLGDTTVHGSLQYADWTANTTHNHIWRVHLHETGRDFFNWTMRCMSTGEVFNPFSLALARSSQGQCSHENQVRCQVGDLHLKFRRIDINSYNRTDNHNRSAHFFYTDTLLPLSGQESIIAKSIVIQDDNAPQLRGKRMACSTIRRQHPIVAVLDNWRTSTGIVSNISGTLEISQESEFDATFGKLKIKGLNRMASGYHIHKAPTPLDKEFPCSSDTVYGHYNPFEFDTSIIPAPGLGSVDEYETGDLSGKFGLLTDLEQKSIDFIDFNLPVLGPYSVIGRSVVIHKQANNFRWSCATIKPKVDKTAREIVAIASFDDPRNLIVGYVRFRQVEYLDGSLSDAWIESHLKHRDNGKKISHGHRWSVYVNSVGADAYNGVDSVRCLAGGYLWNPFLAKVDEQSRAHCNQANGLRCALGDLTGRNGPLVIGGEKQLHSDTHLPFSGNFSVLNRALLISMANNSNTALACANIKLDKHLISNIVVQKIPAFTVAKFMHHMRSLLNAAEWLVVAEVQKTRELNNNECVQILVHFYGDEAFKLQSEFNNLVDFGSIRKGGQLIKTYYKSCKTARTSSTGRPHSLPSIILMLPALVFISLIQL